MLTHGFGCADLRGCVWGEGGAIRVRVGQARVRVSGAEDIAEDRAAVMTRVCVCVGMRPCAMRRWRRADTNIGDDGCVALAAALSGSSVTTLNLPSASCA